MVDEIDRQIIQILIKDGRKSSKEIAKVLHVDSSTIRRRVHRLIHEGIVQIVALPVFSKAGYPLQAIIGLNVDSLEMDNNLKVLNEIPECMFVSVTTGRFNIMIIAWCHSAADVNRLLPKILAKLKGVRTYETFTCVNITKTIDSPE